MLTKLDLKKNLIDHRLAIAEDFVREARLSNEIKKKMQKTIRMCTEKNGFSFDEKEELINELPKHLKYEIAMDMHHRAIRLFPFFTLKDYSFIAAIVPYLQPLLVSVNEYICNVGEIPQNIYFIVNGKVCYVYGKEGIVYRTLTQGHYFGDVEVVKKTIRKHTVISNTDTLLLIMGRKIIKKLQLEFPSIWKEIKTVAEVRDKKIKKALAETIALFKASKNGCLKDLNADEFRELINEEVENQRSDSDEDKESGILHSIKTRHLEIGQIKDHLNENSGHIDRIHSLMGQFVKKYQKIPNLPPPPLNAVRRNTRISLPQLNLRSFIGNTFEEAPDYLTKQESDS